MKKMNNDLISRKALLESYDKAHQGPPGGARKLIEEAPGVDAVEVAHGRWKPDLYHDGQPYRDEWYGYIFKCSVCGGKTMGNYDLECHDNYCPYCGAKMDGWKEK